MCDASVFAQEAEVLFLLGDDLLVLGPQSGGVAREDEGVPVQAGAVIVQLPAGVVDGVVVVVGVNHPVVVVCTQSTQKKENKNESHAWGSHR